MKRTPWWLWTAATFVIVSAWVFFAAIVQLGLADLAPKGEAWSTLLVDLATFIPFFLATPLAWKFILGRPITELVHWRGAPALRRLWVGFGVWIVLCGATTAVDAVMHPSDYAFTFSLARFLPFALVTVLLLPVQTWAEELFFRGWLLNWSAALPGTSSVLISGVLFAWPHMGNPEAAGDAALAFTAYFILGAVWALVSIRSGGIELAMGAHLANNAFALLIVGYADAALPTAAVFTTSGLNLVTTVVSLAVMAPLFAIATRRVR